MSCNQTLGGLAKDCSRSMGGIAEVWIANHDYVETVTVGTSTEIKMITAIAVKTEEKFKKYFFRKGTGSMTHTYNIDPTTGANYVTTDLALQFNKMETAKRVEICALAVNELSVIVKDCNGIYWYLGYDNPVVATAADGATGQAFTDANKYGITLQDNSLELPYEIDPSALESIIE